MSARVISQRQKQIDKGKNTTGYVNYVTIVPRDEREWWLKNVDGLIIHPATPDKRRPCSKRSWEGTMRKWRRSLHQYDDISNK